MRPRQTLLCLLALALGSVLSAAEVKLVRVWPEYRTDESFARIGEYFGGSEKSPELIVRSQTGSRDGYYFLARFQNAEAVKGAILAIETILPGNENAQVHFIPINLPRGGRAVLAGLTGSDWNGAKVKPTAWRVRLLSAGGSELALQQSFLWSLPPAATQTASANTLTTPAAPPPAGN
ncbi:MAG: hypothetical protein RIQ79_2576 [Verrucomicrobiota bacterium]